MQRWARHSKHVALWPLCESRPEEAIACNRWRRVQGSGSLAIVTEERMAARGNDKAVRLAKRAIDDPFEAAAKCKRG